MADAPHVEFESPAGLTFGVYEDFPLAGGPVVGCLVLQPEDGSAPTRVKFDSPEADKLRKRFPELAKVKAPAKDAAAGDGPNATPAAIAHAEATGVDIASVEGTGAGGQVTKADVAKAAE